MVDQFVQLKETLLNGDDAVLVTVIASSGSTPRGAGASMLVTASGRIGGTIGGGAVEFQSEQMALRVLREKQSRTEAYRLHPNDVQDLGMICGGEVTLLFRYMAAGDAQLIEVADCVAQVYRRGERSWLIADITPGAFGGWGVYGAKRGFIGKGIPNPDALVKRAKGTAAQVEQDGRVYYCEQLVRPGVAYIFGGGHVAQALVPVLCAVDFRCIVLEDREAFCKKELFPGAEDVLRVDMSHIADFVTIGDDDYVAVMTRGHKDDQAVQAQVLRTPACYIGVIGSRRKAAGVRANLQAMGFSETDLARIITPIGLEILAETPAEIAISVAAQMIQVRAQRNGLQVTYQVHA